MSEGKLAKQKQRQPVGHKSIYGAGREANWFSANYFFCNNNLIIMSSSVGKIETIAHTVSSSDDFP